MHKQVYLHAISTDTFRFCASREKHSCRVAVHQYEENVLLKVFIENIFSSTFTNEVTYRDRWAAGVNYCKRAAFIVQSFFSAFIF